MTKQEATKEAVRQFLSKNFSDLNDRAVVIYQKHEEFNIIGARHNFIPDIIGLCEAGAGALRIRLLTGVKKNRARRKK